MAKLRWGNGEWITGGSPYLGDPRGTSSHVGAEYNDRVNIKSGPEPSGITFAQLASEYDLDAEILRAALRNRNISFDSDEAVLYSRDVEFIRSTFRLKLKPEIRAKQEAEAKREAAIFYRRSQMAWLDLLIRQEKSRLEALESNLLEGCGDLVLVDEAKRNLRNLERRRNSLIE